MTFPGVQDGILQVFDVEHGGCALLTMPMPNGSLYRILIDCGHNSTIKWYPGEHFRKLGVNTLQLLIVTNYDEDHVSGLRNFIEQGVYIEKILRNPAVSPATIEHLKTKDGMGIGIDTLVRLLTICGDSWDHLPVRSWPLFKARHVLRTLLTANKLPPIS